jgi:glycosyltransferase involved in cell wall biosynthesis
MGKMIDENEILKILTIVIPTYNRKERLLEQLGSIYRYASVNDYYLVLVDNCSDYDVMEAVSGNFPKDFVENIQYVRNKFNTHMGFNLANCFLYPKTPWMLQTSDDDEYNDGFMAIILQYINTYPDACCIQFALGMDVKFGDLRVETLNQVNDGLWKKYLSGDCLYLGNKLYNIQQLHEYMCEAFIYSYSAASFLMPTLHFLWDEKGYMIISDKKLGDYKPNPGAWDFLKVALQISTVCDVPWSDGTNHKQVTYVKNILTGHFQIQMIRFLGGCAKIKEKSYRKYLYHRVMSTIYADCYSPKQVFYRLCYHVEILTCLPIITKGIPSVINVYTEWKQQQKAGDSRIYRLYKKYS